MPASFKASTPDWHEPRPTQTPQTVSQSRWANNFSQSNIPPTMFLHKQTSIINILVFLWMSLSIRNLQLSVTHIQILSSLIRNQSVSERMRRSNLQPVSQGRDLKHKLVEMTRRTFMRWQSGHRQKVVFKSIYSDKARSCTEGRVAEFVRLSRDAKMAK